MIEFMEVLTKIFGVIVVFAGCIAIHDYICCYHKYKFGWVVLAIGIITPIIGGGMLM